MFKQYIFHKNSSKGSAKLITIMVIILIIGAGLYYLYSNYQVPPEKNLQDTSNWKTYTDSTGFSLKYPPDFTIQRSKDSLTFAIPKNNNLYSANIWIFVEEWTKKPSLKVKLSAIRASDKENSRTNTERKIMVNNSRGREFTYAKYSCPETQTGSIYTKSENSCLKILSVYVGKKETFMANFEVYDYAKKDYYYSVFRTILSTFNQ